ncbi:MAG: thiamine pyrophosphate-dependent enzyme, partial [Bacteroidota bacterium]|nr:thiamine pyrophosphate-dependent enzyme [Bacteroidota bacterium]
PDPSLNSLFEQLAQDPSVSILTETTSNIRSEGIHTSIDNILFTLTEEETKTFSPDILITFGGQIVSKRVKAFLRKNPPKEHWFFSISGAHVDTFQCLTTLIDTSPVDILKDLAKLDHPLSAYAELWQKRDELTRFRSKEYLRNCPFSDLTVFNLITEKIPAGYVVHTSNSTPVRYAQLVSMPDHIIYFANRGTSGIDGSVSTAAGSAYASKSPTLLITGDLSFFYDSNALWNRYLTSEFKIVLINNGGGGIFRIIEGPSTSPALEEYIETGHSQSARQLAEGFGVHYLSAKNHQETEFALNRLFKEKGPALLEIFTTGKLNAPILNNYFSFLKTGTKDYLRIEI